MESRIKAISWDNVNYKNSRENKRTERSKTPPRRHVENSSHYQYNYVPPYDFREPDTGEYDKVTIKLINLKTELCFVFKKIVLKIEYEQ